MRADQVQAERQRLLTILKYDLAPRKRAEVEASLYATVSKQERGQAGIGVVLTVLFDLPQSAFEITNRARILNAGSAAAPIWEAMADRGLPMKNAVEILVAGMRRAQEKGTDPAEEVARGVDAWEERSVVVKNAQGKLVRKQLPGAKKADPERAMQDIRDRVEAFAQARGRTIPREDSAPMVAELLADVNALLLGFEARVKREQRRAEEREQRRMPRREINEACELLSIPKPRGPLPVNEEEAKRRFKALARSYHPDRTGGDTRHLFEAAVAAFECVKAWNEEVGGGPDGVEGRAEGA